ncbi:MAG TPA: hypothetical protein VHD89_07195, partial [Rhodanobacteraceae bacterium]|nr:hypothetical protein [Rhodanobacteraceae bacterium]
MKLSDSLAPLHGAANGRVSEGCKTAASFEAAFAEKSGRSFWPGMAALKPALVFPIAESPQVPRRLGTQRSAMIAIQNDCRCTATK